MKYICTTLINFATDEKCGSEYIHRAMFCLWDETLEEWVPESDGVVFEGAEYWCRDCDGCTEPEIVGNEEVENNDE